MVSLILPLFVEVVKRVNREADFCVDGVGGWQYGELYYLYVSSCGFSEREFGW